MQARRSTNLTGRLGGALVVALTLALPHAAFAQTPVTTPAPASDGGAGPTAGNAGAAVVTPAMPSAPAPAAAHWSGAYVGGLFGQARSHSDAATTVVFNPTGYFATTSTPAIGTAGAQTLDAKQATGGVEGGFNVHAGPIVLGAEVDWDRMNISASQATAYPCCAPTAFTVMQSVNTTYLATFRGRLGVAAGHALIYGTGGVAWTNLDYEAVFTDTFATAKENGGVNQKQHAAIWGGGVEVKGGRHWSVKGEFLRSEFDPISTTSGNMTAFTPPIPFPTNVFTHSTTFVLKTFRFGINVGF